MVVITIDGNIGAGKTSIMSYVNSKYSLPIDTEPIDIWQPFLNDLYASKPNASFNMQVRVWLDRCLIQPPKESTIIERSPLFQRGVFIEANKASDSISDIQYTLLQEMYDRIDRIWKPECYIYLRSDPTACSRRIALRARESEDAIPDEYLQKLHYLHEETYDNAILAAKNVEVVNVEGKTIQEIGEEVWGIIKTYI